MSVSKQRRIIVKRSSEAVKKDFFKISNENLYTAMFNLPANAFKLYCYLCDNKNGYVFDFYSSDFERIANITEKTYLKAFNILVDQGYLIPHKNKSTIFMFVEESKLNKSYPNKADKIISLSEDDFELERRQNFSE